MVREIRLGGCPFYGHLYDGGIGGANDNCCFCETVSLLDSIRLSSHDNYAFMCLVFTRHLLLIYGIRHSPTVTPVPTMSAAPTFCTGNTAGWVDYLGDGCVDDVKNGVLCMLFGGNSRKVKKGTAQRRKNRQMASRLAGLPLLRSLL